MRGKELGAFQLSTVVSGTFSYSFGNEIVEGANVRLCLSLILLLSPVPPIPERKPTKRLQDIFFSGNKMLLQDCATHKLDEQPTAEWEAH